MSFFNDLPPSSSAKPPGTTACSLGGAAAAAAADFSVPLHNLSTVQSRMDNLQKYLTDSVNRNTLISKDHMDLVSSEIASAIHQTIVNGAALLACAQNPNTSSRQSIAKRVDQSPDFLQLTKGKTVDQKIEVNEDEDGEDYEVIEIDAVELLAEHIHFCDICGKGFKRDANLRMHMRAHGNQFKTPEALAKPDRYPDSGGCASIGGEMRKARFSCPYVGCNRNQKHKKFRPLKSVICVKNHFKRSHCPKMYSCNRCNKKSFSVVADLKSHLKHCGETKWKCSCGTSFSRKDKLFGHMALFEGHMPAVVEEEEETVVLVVEDDEEDENPNLAGRKQMEIENEAGSNEFLDGLLDGFGSVDNYYFQDLLGSPNAATTTNHEFDGFFNF